MYVLLPDNRSSQPPAPMVYGRIAPMSEKRNSKSALFTLSKALRVRFNVPFVAHKT